MVLFIIRRAGQALLAFFVISVLTFLMVRISGDPVEILTPDEASEQMREEVRRLYHLDEPLPLQYLRWMGGFLTGDFGKSTTKLVPVKELIGQRLPNSLQLAGIASVITLVIGLPIGVYSAANRGSITDLLTRSFAALGQAVPNFWLGLLLILVFAIWVDFFPAGGKAGWSSIVLPAVALGWRPAAGIVRLTRSSMLEVLGSDYVKLARVKGVRETKVLWLHAFKNAALPVLTFSSLWIVGVLGGSIVIEIVFSWPGLGTLTLDAVINRDFPVVQTVVLMLSSWFIAANLLVDIAYVYLNPKIRYS